MRVLYWLLKVLNFIGIAIFAIMLVGAFISLIKDHTYTRFFSTLNTVLFFGLFKFEEYQRTKYQDNYNKLLDHSGKMARSAFEEGYELGTKLAEKKK